MGIYDELIKYSKKGIYPMHMPGHKRNPQFSMCNPYEIDVTEVSGTDNLHHPEEMFRERMNQMRTFYRTKETYMLVNGSTGGLLTAISACCHRGDTIIMDRNCHRAVYNAVYLLELHPIYLYPKLDEKTGIALGVDAEQVRKVVNENEASCVILTSPTYEGIVSDIQKIASYVHEKNMPLIVDEAHGAHFAWSKDMPLSAMEQGADLVVESLHKTLPAFTQTALLHICSERVPNKLIERYLDIYQTSSPSYLLVAGIDQCMEWMMKYGEESFYKYEQILASFQMQAKKWNTLFLWENDQKEPSKLVICTGTSGRTGVELAQILLDKYSIQVEMAAGSYVLAMTSICDTQDGFEKLAKALKKIDEQYTEEKYAKEQCTKEQCTKQQCTKEQCTKQQCTKEQCTKQQYTKEQYMNKQYSPERDGQELRNKLKLISAKVKMSAYEAMNATTQITDLEKSIGEIAAEYAFIYPPGIPFLAPGEVISETIVSHIKWAKGMNLELMGLSDDTAKTIKTIKTYEDDSYKMEG